MQLTPRRLTTLQKTVLIQVLLSFHHQRVGVSYWPSNDDRDDPCRGCCCTATAAGTVGWERSAGTI
jgi:hypothetical protein